MPSAPGILSPHVLELLTVVGWGTILSGELSLSRDRGTLGVAFPLQPASVCFLLP